MCTDESLSLFYLLFISRLVYARRLYIDKLGIFQANQTSIYLVPYHKIRLMLVPSNIFKPPSIFFLTVSMWCFFSGSFLLFVFRVCLSYCLSNPCRLVVPCWNRADLLALLFVMFSCVFVTFQYGLLGQVWYLIVSISEFCLRSCFA